MDADAGTAEAAVPQQAGAAAVAPSRPLPPPPPAVAVPGLDLVLNPDLEEVEEEWSDSEDESE